MKKGIVWKVVIKSPFAATPSRQSFRLATFFFPPNTTDSIHPTMDPEWYKVYLVKYNIPDKILDPHMPPGRKHHAVFVKTTLGGTGHLHHVIGSISMEAGMPYENKPNHNPFKAKNFHSRELLGYTRRSTHPEKWDSVLGALPTPPRQKAPNPLKEGQYEPFKEQIGDDEFVFYEEGEEHKPLSKCTEWIELHALPALWSNNLIQKSKDEEPSTKA